MDRGRLMLVGSVARPADGWDVEDVLRNAGRTLGEHASMLPDGEVGDRFFWIHFVARHIYALHPDMVTVSRHTLEDWHPTGYHDRWRFTLRDGVRELRFDKIGYADIARESYAVFRRLRDEGIIAEGVRFKVALPFVESATRAFIDSPEHLALLWPAYQEAIAREVADMCAAIPHRDLALQWDVCFEVAAAEGLATNFDAPLVGLPQDPMERFADTVRSLCPSIPEDVWLGIHLCYGSLGHKKGETSDSGHFVEIKDLNVCVDMANEAIRAAGRPVQFVHMPVQYSNGLRDSYYAPLDRLEARGARTYLGLVHLHDGVDGALNRIDIARRHLPNFGIATQCGWGRRPPDQSIRELLQLHRDIAESRWGSS